MYYIVQENTFREENYNNLILALNRLELSYEIIKVYPFVDLIEFETNRKDIFLFGSLKLASLSKLYNWKPGSMMNDNHDFLKYREYYQENLLNYDSKIIKFGDEFFQKERFFARPTKDTKVFTGKVFDMKEWNTFKINSLTNGHSTILNRNSEIQISTIKKIQQEIRFWIIKGEIITASQYMLGNRYCLNDVIDQAAYEFCKEMIKLFQLNDAFVMDIGLTNGQYKIIECGCINCAGFYKANLQKLLMGLEFAF